MESARRRFASSGQRTVTLSRQTYQLNDRCNDLEQRFFRGADNQVAGVAASPPAHPTPMRALRRHACQIGHELRCRAGERARFRSGPAIVLGSARGAQSGLQERAHTHAHKYARTLTHISARAANELERNGDRGSSPEPRT